jgi:hypothetical protein
MNTYKRWSIEETILLTDFVVAHRGLPWSGPAPSHPEERFAEIRDMLFPDRSPDSVYMQAWNIAIKAGYCSDSVRGLGGPFSQIEHVIGLFRDNEAEMSHLARDIGLLRQIRRGRPVLASQGLKVHGDQVAPAYMPHGGRSGSRRSDLYVEG